MRVRVGFFELAIQDYEEEDRIMSALGRAQILLSSPELQVRLGRKYCDETELLPLLLAHGVVRCVRTIEIEVQPLGGESFKVQLDAAQPSVGEAKLEISRSQGTPSVQQELYKVAVRADGLVVREDDAEPNLLERNDTALGNGDVVTMVVIDEPPLLWRTCPLEYITICENGAVATYTGDHPTEDETVDFDDDMLVTAGDELTQGRHYWEVALVEGYFMVGVSRPHLEPKADYARPKCSDGWFICAGDGGLYGNGKKRDDAAGDYDEGDRVGVLLDLDAGSLLFFINGVQHGPGYLVGSVTPPVVPAVQMMCQVGSEVTARCVLFTY
jgi:hypothetical protein